MTERYHQWSGWPGAYCLVCGVEDKREVCLADEHDLDPELGVVCERPECQNRPCPGTDERYPTSRPPKV